nr:uncharacterized protein LOC104102497 [Nicotiana tomentosiformis]
MWMHPAGEMIKGGMPNNDLALPRQEEASSSRAAVDVSSSAGDRGKTVAEEDARSDSDMDLEELRMIDDGLSQLEIEGTTLEKINDGTLSNNIAGLALRTVILEFESARRERRHTNIYVKLKDKYTTCLRKYRELQGRFREGSDVMVPREDLKKRDEELMQAVEKCIILEGTLRSKEEELELSRGVEAQCRDLQAQVVQVRGQLEECQFKAEALSGEVAEKQKELDKAESSRSEVQRTLKFLDLANRTLRSKRENDLLTARAKDELLDERIRELEKETSDLYDRVAALEAEKARLEALCELHATGSISGAAFEDARVKAHEAQIVCGYNPATPYPSKEDKNGADVWYDSMYPKSEDGEDAEGRDGDGVDGQGGDVAEGRSGEDVVGREGDGE